MCMVWIRTRISPSAASMTYSEEASFKERSSLIPYPFYTQMNRGKERERGFKLQYQASRLDYSGATFIHDRHHARRLLMRETSLSKTSCPECSDLRESHLLLWFSRA
ncbi:hypothetical protein KP509_08G034800 [Ceratopteris richardii]|uniref:Uncharacterized protein n=1 Tax=Ceratopteris richardii TaxID=49495 RepID=A0A8T2U748_CERRI|nr:hypothetical protein KP509_08G034800 [Ceratopteris richardii]